MCNGDTDNSKIRLLLQKASRILVTSHQRPDGDAIFSVLAMGLSLEAIGKSIQMVLGDGVPVLYRFIEGSEKITTRAVGEFDLIIVLDSSDLQRTGNILDGLKKPDINIDHHVTNLKFAIHNLVDVNAVATTEILAMHMEAWGLPSIPIVVDALLAGILSDTIGFRTSNMTSRALRVSADLVDAGADLPFLYQKVLMRRSFQAAKLWGNGLLTMEKQDGLVWTVLTQKDRKLVGYPGKDDADLINMIASIDDIEVALLLVEQPDRRVKVSWRATGERDITPLALRFGGGGHRAAAGAMIEGNLEEVKNRILEETIKFLKE